MARGATGPTLTTSLAISTGWIHKDVKLDDELQKRWMLFYDVSEHYSRLVTSRFVNFYVMYPAQMLNMGYDDPERSGHLEWVKLTPADYAMNQREHFTAAKCGEESRTDRPSGPGRTTSPSTSRCWCRR